MFGNFIHGLKKAGIGFYGACCQVHAVGFLGKRRIRFIKSDMPIVSKTQKLQVNPAALFNYCIVVRTCLLGVFFQTIWNMGACFVNIDMVEEIRVHKIAVALVIFR